MQSRTKRGGALVLASALLGGAGSWLAFGGASADATPLSQGRCSFGFRQITTADGWQQLGLGVSLDNGVSARRVIGQLAADIGVDPGAEVRVGYSVDGGPVREKTFGPGNLANASEFWETRSTVAIFPMSAGTHTVTPYWRISGVAGKNAFFEDGCFTVEGRTR